MPDGVRHRKIDGAVYIRAEDLIEEMDLLVEDQNNTPKERTTILFLRNYVAGIQSAGLAGTDPVA